MGPDSSVGIATGYGLDGPGIESRCGRDFPHLSRPALGPTQPAVQWVSGLSRGGKELPGREADPSPLLVPWSRKSRVIPLLPLWAVRPVQSLSACTRVHCTLPLSKFRKRAVRISIRGRAGFTVHMPPFLVENTLKNTGSDLKRN